MRVRTNDQYTFVADVLSAKVGKTVSVRAYNTELPRVVYKAEMSKLCECISHTDSLPEIKTTEYTMFLGHCISSPEAYYTSFSFRGRFENDPRVIELADLSLDGLYVETHFLPKFRSVNLYIWGYFDPETITYFKLKYSGE